MAAEQKVGTEVPDKEYVYEALVDDILSNRLKAGDRPRRKVLGRALRC